MTSEGAPQRDNGGGGRLLGGFVVNVKSRELMVSLILYPYKTPGGGEERGRLIRVGGARGRGREGGEREQPKGKKVGTHERGRRKKGEVSRD